MTDLRYVGESQSVHLNNLIKTAYKSKCYISTMWLFADVISPTFLFVAGDPNRKTMYPDQFQEGIHRFIECKSLHCVFNFVCQYV